MCSCVQNVQSGTNYCEITLGGTNKPILRSCVHNKQSGTSYWGVKGTIGLASTGHAKLNQLTARNRHTYLHRSKEMPWSLRRTREAEQIRAIHILHVHVHICTVFCLSCILTTRTIPIYKRDRSRQHFVLPAHRRPRKATMLNASLKRWLA